MSRRASTLAGVAALAGVLVLAACGDDGGSSSSYVEPEGEAQETVTIHGGSNYFDPEEVELPAGVDAIEFVGDGNLHTLLVEGVDGFKLRVEEGGDTDTKKLELEPGEYEYYCDITGHREAGMEGTLVVE